MTSADGPDAPRVDDPAAVADVRAAAEARAAALGRRDAAALTELLHPSFAWTSHTGASFDRATYVRSNTRGEATWHGQRLEQVEITVVGDTAVLRCVVQDDVETAGARQLFRMPMTQVWVRHRHRWLCLAGHAGPRLLP